MVRVPYRRANMLPTRRGMRVTYREGHQRGLGDLTNYGSIRIDLGARKRECVGPCLW